MKPVHIVVLVLAGALGGAMVMKVVQRPEPAASVVPTAVSVPQSQAHEAAPVAPVPQAETPAPQPQPQIEEKPAARPPAPPPLAKVRSRQVRRQAPPPANPRPLIVDRKSTR